MNTGVAYQLTDSDPLINTAQCQRDADLMGTLGVNSIRVYHVDSDCRSQRLHERICSKGNLRLGGHGLVLYLHSLPGKTEAFPLAV